MLPSSEQALRAALKAGVTVCLATGKARPAAIAAMQSVGLAGALVAGSTSAFACLFICSGQQRTYQAK